MRTRTSSFPSQQAIFVAIAVAAAIGIFAAWRIVEARPATIDLGAPRAAGPQTALGNFNPAMIYQARSAGVVTIDATINGDPVGGTGFVVDGNGHVVTASHVVFDHQSQRSPDALYVEFTTGDRVAATLLGIDAFNDIAVLKVDQRQVALKPVPIGDSDRVAVGEPVAAIGAPFGNKGSLSTGIVSAIGRTVPSEINERSQIADMIQTDTAINRGNSGGPLFDGRGEVIGLNQQIKTTSGSNAGLAFSVPSNTVKRSVEQIIRTGRVQYSWIGVTSWTVTPQFAAQRNLPVDHGVIVQQAIGPAEAAGLAAGSESVLFMGQEVRLGDQVTALAGVPVRSVEDMARIAARLDVGTPTQVTFWRNGDRHEATLVPQART